ncbi:ATP-binding protein [Pedobacter montanisoli]|uniref:histidine kinase n=1 Tax=Pedobacter montanisoli TaxID=2923277 RepID=A0ABS9ZVK4_9SPHI|nr:tetratricopeptide repeat-containing sensor histidine kinase [Pedobacter montanisoli]MCJ0742124.1 tetratricopeptide repeat-containing sensor histidine kinase [Pedobacter montanisoli]
MAKQVSNCIEFIRILIFRVINEILDTFKLLTSKSICLGLLILIFLGACKKYLKHQEDYPEQTQVIITRAAALSKEDPRLLIHYIDSLSKNFTSAGPGDRWKLLSVKSNMYIFNLRDTAEAFKVIDSMYAIVKDKVDRYPQNYAWTLYNHAKLLLYVNRNDEAFDHFYDGLEFAKKHLDSCDVGTFYDALGRMKIKQLKFDQAIPYFKKAAKYVGTCKPSPKEPGRIPFIQSTLNDIGMCYERINKLDSAIHYYQQALDTLYYQEKRYRLEKNITDYYRGEFLGNLGGVYALTGKEKQAEEYLKTSAALTIKPDCRCSESISSLNKLFKLYLAQNRFSDANNLLQQIKIEIDKNPSLKEDLDQWLLYHELSWKYFDLKGQTHQAYRAINSYYHLRDSIADVRKQLISIDIENKFKFKEQQQQLALLAKDNKIKNLSLFTAVVFVVMAVLIIWIVIVNLKKSRRQVLKLTTLNKRVYEQNEQLQYTLQDLEQSQRENTEMLLVVAHDLRNPIGAMTMLSQLMLKADRSKEDQHSLNLIREAGDRSLALVNDLLKTNTQKEKLKKEALDVRALLKYCVGLLEIKAAQKQLCIELDAKPTIIYGDREKLWRVISNLIGNAVKFSHSNTTIKVSLTPEKEYVLIAVADQGIGIPIELQTKIFDMPSETKRVGTAGEATFGLGLAISRQIVEAHGGKIWFESIQNQCTTFFVRLPTCVANPHTGSTSCNFPLRKF